MNSPPASCRRAGSCPPDRQPLAAPRRRNLLAAVALIAAVAAAYSPVTTAGFIWDDDFHVTRNRLLDTPRGLAQIWLVPTATPQYYPLVHTVFWIQHLLWGDRPLGYHLVNVLLHAAAAILLWSLLRILEIPGAWLGAAIWALHPVQVESVAWVTELKNVLSGVFALAAAVVFLSPAAAGEGRASQTRVPGEGPKRHLAVLLLFSCGLLSKTVVATLPFALATITWWKRRRLDRGDILRLLPLALMGAAMGLVTACLERYKVGAVGAEWAFSPAERLIIAGRAFWFYLGKLAWPAELAFFYHRWEISGRWWLRLYPAAALALLATLWWLRRRLGRGPVAALLIYGLTLAPAMGFINVYPMRYSFVADHFQYLAGIAPLAAAAAAITVAARRMPRAPVATAAIAALLLTPLALQTWRQTHVYRNLETLWRDTIRKTPSSWAAHSSLATLLNTQGKDEEALVHYRDAIRLHPGDPQPLSGMGTVLARQGKTEEATALFHEAARLNPDFYVPLFELGKIMLAKGDIAGAESYFRRAAYLMPDRSLPLFFLGNALVAAGRAAEALPYYRQAIAVDPAVPQYHYQTAMVLLSFGMNEEAAGELRAVLQADPGNQSARAHLERLGGGLPFFPER